MQHGTTTEVQLVVDGRRRLEVARVPSVDRAALHGCWGCWLISRTNSAASRAARKIIQSATGGANSRRGAEAPSTAPGPLRPRRPGWPRRLVLIGASGITGGLANLRHASRR